MKELGLFKLLSYLIKFPKNGETRLNPKIINIKTSQTPTEVITYFLTLSDLNIFAKAIPTTT